MKTIVQLVEKQKEYILEKDKAAKQAVEANIAPVEADPSSASRAYVVGEQLFLNDVLYDVTSPISVGDAIVVNTNITAANKLSADIQSKQDQIEVTTMPTASASNVGKVLIYIGATTSTYTSGQSYQSTLEGGNYIWKPTSISSVDASDVVYDNQTSGLTATDSQAAIDELASQNQTLTNQVKDMNNVLGAKNLLPTPYIITKGGTYTDNGITLIENSDGSLTCSGTNTSSSMWGVSLQYHIDASGLSGKKITISADNAPLNENGYIPIIFKDSNGTIVARYDIDSVHPSYTFTVPSNAVTYDLQIYVRSGKSLNTTLYPMIRLASITDDTYEPYAKTNLQLTQDSVTWDNLSEVGAVNYAPNNLVTQTVSQANFTLTHNADDSITVYSDGATSWSVEVCSITLKAGTYRLKGTGTDDVKFQITDNPLTRSLYAAGANDVIMTFATDTAIKLRVSVFDGKSYNNVVIYPMITSPSYNGPYVPYAKTNKELTEDVAIKSSEITVNTTNVDSENIARNYVNKSAGVKVLVLQAKSKTDLVAGTTYELGTVPSDYLPTLSIGFVKEEVVNSGGLTALIEVSNDKLKLTPRVNNIPTSGSFIVSVTYI